MDNFEVYKRVIPSLGPILFRNIFLLVNIVIFVVVILLLIFGSTTAGLFLGIVFFLNTLIAVSQDIHARVLLERLQMLTALKVVRINNDKTETSILAEKILKGDFIRLRLGDQAPCDGLIIAGENLEISEALITGESDSFSKNEGEGIIAGAIITSGNGIMKAQGLYEESRLSIIAGDVKKYAANPSSIQTSINHVIKYSGYILIFVLLFIISKGIIVGTPKLEIISTAGALASTIIPQGLVVVITLLFAIGASNYSRRNVLFQEINATEKLGRIKNICIDKTGTLTDNILVVEEMHILKGFLEEDVYSLTHACVIGLSDTSQTILAVKKYLEEKNGMLSKETTIVKALPFSSWRRYGAVEVEENSVVQSIFIGSPDIMLPRISNEIEKKWLENIVGENAKLGKRVLCVARGSNTGLPKDLSDTNLSMMAMFVFHNTLRQGIENTIKFFQNRGIEIRVLSGDNAETVKSVARSVGINNAEKVITGAQMEKWSPEDYLTRAHDFSVFAQILPEHKVKLVEAFKKDGFTGMVGDGVNDAPAMKNADIGIAMFDGAPVTRQLADVILMTNSFSDLPGAVELADNFIRSIELNSGIYINQSLSGLFFFIIISLLGYTFPITPLNVTFINYFTVGFSGILVAYWALRPLGKILPSKNQPFLKRVMPLVFYSAIIEAIGIAIVFLLGPNYLKTASSNILVILSFIFFGYIFLFLAMKVYCGSITKKETKQLLLLGVFQIVVIYIAFQIPFVLHFFNIELLN
ncbi:MAG: HAD-IC family P-type ATPase [bacterium]